RARRFPGWPGGMDRREIPHLERRANRARRPPDERLALLVYRRDRLIVLAVLLAHARWLADPARKDDRRAGRLRRVPQGNPAAAALPRGEDLHRHPALERHEKGRPF